LAKSDKGSKGIDGKPEFITVEFLERAVVFDLFGHQGGGDFDVANGVFLARLFDCFSAMALPIGVKVPKEAGFEMASNAFGRARRVSRLSRLEAMRRQPRCAIFNNCAHAAFSVSTIPHTSASWQMMHSVIPQMNDVNK
jgi:hypothetical protein